MDRRDYMSEYGTLLSSIPHMEIDLDKMQGEAYDEDTETAYVVHLCYEVCGTCGGKGTHVNPGIDAHGITPEEFSEDPDFREDYFRGNYDVPCYECKGQRVSVDVDRDATDKETLKWMDDWFNDEMDYRSTCEMERRMGC